MTDYDNLKVSDVRKYLKEARATMRDLERLMQDNNGDYSEGSELGQTINELIALVGYTWEWREQRERASKV